MRRRRRQNGSVSVRKHGQNRVWVAQWWDSGTRRSKVLGPCSALTKTEAQNQLAAILLPINNQSKEDNSGPITFGEFIRAVFTPFKMGSWKKSTAGTSKQRIDRFLVEGPFGKQGLKQIRREQLQQFLNEKAREGLSYSVVAHLRWDLKAIFRFAQSEGYVERNPAAELYIPKEAALPECRVLNAEESRRCLAVLEIREKAIAMLALFSGLRPGEIFGLKLKDLKATHVNIVQRVYRGEIDTPKTARSKRSAAVGLQTQACLREWQEYLTDRSANAWLFPSETGNTPLSKDNCWRRSIAPKFNKAGLPWVNFQVMRRTWSTLSEQQGVNPKVRADQMGHGIGVNVDVYTQTGLEQRLKAVNQVENAVFER